MAGTTTPEYTRPTLVVHGSRLLDFASRSLPPTLGRRFYDAVFAAYRSGVRVLYLRRWMARLAAADRPGLVRAAQVYRVMPYSLVGWRGLEVTRDLVVDLTTRGIDGALVECGVARGGCTALMAMAAAERQPARAVWGFDSFEGLPDPGVEDFVSGRGRTGAHLQRLERGSCLGTIEDVRTLLFDTLGLRPETVKLVKGWFQDTLPSHRDLIGPIALLRLDGDWYDSIKTSLDNLYDRVVPGGYVLVDDYDTCHGARAAVDEFLGARGITVHFGRDGRGGRYFVKPALA